MAQLLLVHTYLTNLHGGTTGVGVSLPLEPGGTTGVGVSLPLEPGGTTGVGVSLPLEPGGTTGVGVSLLLEPGGTTAAGAHLPLESLEEVLCSSRYNWFHLVDDVEEESGMEKEAVGLCQYLDQFYHHVLPLLSCSERALLQQSYEAFKVSIPHSDEVRDAAILNGDIVSDSEVEDAESYIGLSSISSAKTQWVLAKKRKPLARKVRREKAKALDSGKCFAHKVNKRMKTIVDKFPDIGQSIEEYVKECNVGADAWQCTGILIFHGNRRVKQKPMYR